jgi:flagellar export protein FliJ
MSGRNRFRYALEPVLRTRQWELDALLLELGNLNAVLAALRAELAQLDEESRQTAAAWTAHAAAAASIAVGQLALVTRYVQELAEQALAKQQAIAAQERERDALIARVMASQRSVEAVEKHRDESEAAFIKLQLSSEFKVLDDHWSTLQANVTRHDNES